MGIKEKIRATYEFFKIEKYTKRRTVLNGEFQSQDPDYYKTNYADGVYVRSNTSPHRNSGLWISSLKRNKSARIMRSSEIYNASGLSDK
ncbi:uncharacterized protein VTP21DRAFT_10625 [Calcarisporiella thermophila]|uniref:uncharacterized protein n=1 Tax=Calcarisporiella thermophila TaxID=911321 RepID=UPI003743286B